MASTKVKKSNLDSSVFTDLTIIGNISATGYFYDANGLVSSAAVTSLSSTVDANFALKSTITSLSSTVDANFATKSSVLNYLPLSGGTLTGTVDLSAVTEIKATPTISLSALNLNLTSAVMFLVNLNSNITTFTFTNVPPSPRVYSFALQLSADGTPRTVVWPTGTRWSGGTGPTLTSTAGKVDTFTFFTHDGGVNWFAATSIQNQ